jgi:hypothetical protein
MGPGGEASVCFSRVFARVCTLMARVSTAGSKAHMHALSQLRELGRAADEGQQRQVFIDRQCHGGGYPQTSSGLI